MDYFSRYSYIEMFKMLCLRCLKPLPSVNKVGLFSTKESQTIQLEKDDDGTVALCFDTILSGNAVIVFCPTKQWCEQLAESIAKQVT